MMINKVCIPATIVIISSILGFSSRNLPTAVAAKAKSNQWAWTMEKWTGEEEPYRQMRNSIDQLISNGKNPADLARKFKAEAKSWMEPKAQFRWAYAAYEGARRANFINQERTLQDISNALRNAAGSSSSRNYEYARLRFLALVRILPTHKLKPIGERLVQRNLKDYEVRYYYVSVLDPGLYEEEKSIALHHANALTRAMPDKPTVHSLLGEVYWKIWIKSGRAEDADKSIAGYQKFLDLAPPSHPFRKPAEKQIAFIRQMQAHRAKRMAG